MWKKIAHLFNGRNEGASSTSAERLADVTSSPTPSPPITLTLPSSDYFNQLEQFQAAVSARNYREAALAARTTFKLIEEWLSAPQEDEERTNIRMPTLMQGGTILALVHDQEGLDELKRLTDAFNYLEAYRDLADDHFLDMALLQRIRAALRKKPGILQTQLKGELDVTDGRRVSRLVAYLEKADEVCRQKAGKTYKLFPAEQ